LTNPVCLSAANLLPLLVIQLTLREIFAGNYHVIQVPAKETRQEEQRRIHGYNKVAKIYYTGRVHREIPVKTIRPFISFFSRIFFARIESHRNRISSILFFLS